MSTALIEFTELGLQGEESPSTPDRSFGIQI